MTNIVLLNNVDHFDLKVIIGHSVTFGDGVNKIPVLPTEFEEIQREYPIFFHRDEDGALQAIALLGLDRDENLFLDQNGWQGRYVPAMLQRGAFLIGLTRDGTEGDALIHIDLDHPRVSTTKGLSLFLPHGGNAPYLEHIARILRVIHVGVETSAPMYAVFEQAGLIEPITVEILLSETKKYVLSDLFAIGGGALAKLDASWLDRLNRAGYLSHAFYAAASLANVSRLIDLKNRAARTY
jgi:hypothetical protein